MPDHAALRYAGCVRSGFTMMDLMVSMAVISVLIALMLPAIARVRESTHKVICASNMRQLGMGVSVYAQDHRERLPGSVFLAPSRTNASSYPSPERMDTVRLDGDEFTARRRSLWDGLGLLYGLEYVGAPNIYYCPSHTGNYRLEDAIDAWNQVQGQTEIIANYLYRGTGPDDSRVLYNIDPTAALVTDSLRSYEDLNHDGGFNILQAGLAVNWFNDVGDQIAQDILSRSSGDDGGISDVNNVWSLLDGLPGAAQDNDDGMNGGG